MELRVDPNLTIGWRVWKVKPPAPSAVLIVKAAYNLVPGALTPLNDDSVTVLGDAYTDDDPEKSLRYPSDLAVLKPRADILLVGSAHAPGGTPVEQLTVRLTVGGWSKALDVVGPRTWSNGVLGRANKPERFTVMPLSWENAFGGPGDKKNPAGKGRKSEMHTLEVPGQWVRNISDTGDPANFGPVSPGWPARTRFRGTYDRSWQRDRWPWFPVDFDWAFFNAAPPDQQPPGYLAGNESLELENLHPEHPRLVTRLPGLRARWFVNDRQPDRSFRFREVPLNLDTLYIDTDKSRVILVWRGLTEVRSVRLAELEQHLVIAEPLAPPPGEPRRGPDFYEAELVRRLAPPEEPADPALEAAEREADQLKREADATKAEMLKQKAEAPPPAEPETPPIDEYIANVVAHIAGLEAAGTPATDPGLVDAKAALILLEEHRDDPSSDPLWTADRVRRLAAQKKPFTDVVFDDLNLAGFDLSGLDFTGAVFVGVSLAGAALRGAKLVGTSFLRCDLSGADLTGAVLDGADLTGVKLTGAKLTGLSLNNATLSKLDLPGADFRGAKGLGADFSGSNLAGAKFLEAEFVSVHFSKCDVSGATFAGSSLRIAVFEGAKAERACLRGADLTKAQCSDGADFSEADLREVKAADSAWHGSVFRRATLSGGRFDRAVFAEACLAQATADRCVFTAADFSDADLTEAVLTRSNFLKASFDRARLEKADVRESNLYEAGLWDAVTKDAKLEKANLKNSLLAK